MVFRLYIFNLSWTSHSFSSIWKTFSVIPIHKMGKPLHSPASFRPTSLTSCVSKLFERMILSRLLFLLESNSILSPGQAGFRPGRSTLDLILYLSQSSSSARIRSWPSAFFLFIKDLRTSLPSSVRCSLYTDDLVIWSISPSVPTAIEVTQEALFRLERWSEDWYFPINLSKCEASFLSVDPNQANLQPNLLLLNSRLRFNPTLTFFGVTFDGTLSYSNHVSLLKSKYFPRLKKLRCISASS